MKSGRPRRSADPFRRRQPAHRLLLALLTLVGLAAILPTSSGAETTPDVALAEMLDDARAAATAPGGCARPGIDRLVSILCAQRMRVGVRENYPLFATAAGGTRHGYEIDVARAVARKLGVEAQFVKVKPTTRIPMLADDRIDLLIATMGHNTQRDSEVRFVRPHYYRSETVLVGPRDAAVLDWDDLRGRTVCVTVGNGSNAALVSHGVRLMLFDRADMLPDRLADQTCTFAAQDDSFFAYYLNDPEFARRVSIKLRFARMPWGMAVGHEGSSDLASALDLISRIFHRDGIFLNAAIANRIGTEFLVEQQAVWALPRCNSPNAESLACLLQPFDAAVEPTPFVPAVQAFERWSAALTGIEWSLPMLKTKPAWELFLNGIVNSAVLIVGTLAATLVFALLFSLASASRFFLLRWPACAVTIALQSCPILLILVIAATISHSLVPYSSAVALSAAIVSLGLVNGSNAGQAISEAYQTLQAERSASPTGSDRLFSRAVIRSATQIVAFLINAAKGTPIASFIGAPELLSTLTDITSFSSERVTSYTILLVFYTVAVIGVVWLCRRLQAFLQRGYAAI